MQDVETTVEAVLPSLETENAPQCEPTLNSEPEPVGTSESDASSEGSANESDNFQSSGDEESHSSSESQFQEQEPQFLLTKFTLYETKRAFYMVGSNSLETKFRVLLIEFDPELAFSEPYGSLSRAEILKLLDFLEEEARRAHDHVAKRQQAWAIMGCVKFTSVYYLCLVTRCSPVALLGGNYIFHVDETKLIPIASKTSYREPDKRSVEARLLGIFNSMELSRSFYFSHSYQLTQTLQTNLIRGKQGLPCPRNEMFMWNNYLLEPMTEELGATVMQWCTCLIHGFIAQARISVFGNGVYLTLIARRSHHFAGARYLKRGICNEGHVANEVETEQIVSNELSSSFHDPRNGKFGNTRFTSYVQHRGSIAVKWSQTVSNISPKPPITLDGVDPFYSQGARHFNSMFGRYGSPIRVLNLIKQHEARPREKIVGKAFKSCINYLNQFLPPQSKIHYTAFDMSRISKMQPTLVILFLEDYAAESVSSTGIFHNGRTIEETSMQNGVCRTNCIDCLDRTNAAQSVIAKRAFGVQLKALGVIDHPQVEYDTDAVDLLNAMWRDHGDMLALQYGGSNLVNTMETYRQVNQWKSQSRDLIESVRRFYTNSFVDSQRQDAINLFLGNYQTEFHKDINIWDMSTDYYLHNDFSVLPIPYSYQKWFSPGYLDSMKSRVAKGSYTDGIVEKRQYKLPGLNLMLEHHWARLYRTNVLTSLSKLFLATLNPASETSSRKPKSPFVQYRNVKLESSQVSVPSQKTPQDVELPEDVDPEETKLVQQYAKYTDCDTLLGSQRDLVQQYEPLICPNQDEDTTTLLNIYERSFDFADKQNEILQQYSKLYDFCTL